MRWWRRDGDKIGGWVKQVVCVCVCVCVSNRILLIICCHTFKYFPMINIMQVELVLLLIYLFNHKLKKNKKNNRFTKQYLHHYSHYIIKPNNHYLFPSHSSPSIQLRMTLNEARSLPKLLTWPDLTCLLLLLTPAGLHWKGNLASSVL